MTAIDVNDGGPAFPANGSAQPGMSLRDYLAGQAMAGFTKGRDAEMYNDQTARWYAVAAYQLADAMLAERERAETTERMVVPKRQSKIYSNHLWRIGGEAH